MVTKGGGRLCACPLLLSIGTCFEKRYNKQVLIDDGEDRFLINDIGLPIRHQAIRYP